MVIKYLVSLHYSCHKYFKYCGFFLKLLGGTIIKKEVIRKLLAIINFTSYARDSRYGPYLTLETAQPRTSFIHILPKLLSIK